MTLLKAGRTIVAALVVVVQATAAPGSGYVDMSVSGRATNANASIAATDRFVAITWGAATTEGATDIFAATSRDAGKTFGRPTRVNDRPGTANVSGEQPPRITLIERAGKEPAILVVWTSKAATGTQLLSARSDDGGVSFGRSGLLPGSDAPGNRGWESTATDGGGRVMAIWLDHRELAMGGEGGAGMSHPGHDHAAQEAARPDGVARAQLSKLLFAQLGGSAGPREITGGVCYCCKTTIAAGAKGTVYAAWRHVYPGNVRDIAFTASRDNGRTFAAPVRVSEDRWVLDGCPENGPAMAVDTSEQIHLVWPTLVAGAAPQGEPALALFYASSRDGQHFTPRQQIPTAGLPRHPQIAMDRRGGIVVTWDEEEHGTRRVVVARGTREGTGTIRFARQVLDTVRGVYPAVAATGEGIVVVWASGPATQSIIRVQPLPTN